ncbi:hypothetical protein DID76_04240 [Candidatus Marinamargulisbacteria bacterium SCGC AG-414-C22]|nr:hypothetical protein DID76_04240 [Candidatus Marinamargulisbacteria bacterium SCGC AG-414-C22]
MKDSITLSSAFIQFCQTSDLKLPNQDNISTLNIIPFVEEIKLILKKQYSNIKLSLSDTTEFQNHSSCIIDTSKIIITEKKSIKTRTFIFDLKSHTITLNNQTQSTKVTQYFIKKLNWFIKHIDNPKMKVLGTNKRD